MSFARSKRFSEKKEYTPGPGQYQSDWGCFGRDSIKYRIHTTPRFPECRIKTHDGRRICIACTCADISRPFSKNQFTLVTPPHYCVKNITFRGRRATGMEFRKALRDLVLFRRANGDNTFFDDLKKEKYNKKNNEMEDVPFYCSYNCDNTDDEDHLSCSPISLHTKEENIKSTHRIVKSSKTITETKCTSTDNNEVKISRRHSKLSEDIHILLNSKPLENVETKTTLVDEHKIKSSSSKSSDAEKNEKKKTSTNNDVEIIHSHLKSSEENNDGIQGSLSSKCLEDGISYQSEKKSTLENKDYAFDAEENDTKYASTDYDVVQISHSHLKPSEENNDGIQGSISSKYLRNRSTYQTETKSSLKNKDKVESFSFEPFHAEKKGTKSTPTNNDVGKFSQSDFKPIEGKNDSFHNSINPKSLEKGVSHQNETKSTIENKDKIENFSFKPFDDAEKKEAKSTSINNDVGKISNSLLKLSEGHKNSFHNSINSKSLENWVSHQAETKTTLENKDDKVENFSFKPFEAGKNETKYTLINNDVAKISISHLKPSEENNDSFNNSINSKSVEKGDSYQPGKKFTLGNKNKVEISIFKPFDEDKTETKPTSWSSEEVKTYSREMRASEDTDDGFDSLHYSDEEQAVNSKENKPSLSKNQFLNLTFKNLKGTWKRLEETDEGYHSYLKIIKSIVRTQNESRVRQHEENCSKQSLIMQCLEFLEKKLINQRKETAEILSLISMLQKEAMVL